MTTDPEVLRRLEAVEGFIKSLQSTTTIPKPVDAAFRARFINIFGDLPDGLFSAPLSSITAPTGGATIDSNARTAINSIIDRLESLGLVDPN